MGACETRKNVEDLVAPVYSWSRSNRLCGKNVAVDGHRSVWREEGCENGRPGLAQTSTATTEKVDLIEQSFLRLLDADVSQVPMSGQCAVHSFQRRLDDGSVANRSACSSSLDVDDVTGLPEPFLAVANAFLQLP